MILERRSRTRHYSRSGRHRRSRSVALTGGSASSSAITYTLGTIGGLVGGGMAAGLGLLIGVHALAGGAAYGISKVIKKRSEDRRT